MSDAIRLIGEMNLHPTQQAMLDHWEAQAASTWTLAEMESRTVRALPSRYRAYAYWVDVVPPDYRALFERVWSMVKQSHFDRRIARQRLRKNRRHWNRR